MKSFTAGANENDVRLSRFVEDVTKDMPRSMMYKAFRNKRIKVNGKRAEPDTRLSAGDLIELYINDEFFPPEATWTHPAGGMFLWITLPDYMDTDSMLAEALESGVTYVPGNSFFPDGKTGRNSMRVNFSFETPESITEAIRRLAKVIEERLELYRVFIEAGALPGYDRKDAAMDENATSWKDVIVDSEQNEEAVMQAREGDAEQIEIAEEKVTEAQEAAAE